ncbi:MAG: ferritin-like domain-containing protein [Mitsuaria chitosanitabida]|uniref:ferritin-like domain-containing protein n=1 Tax=Roseateles chitosanitabidus TaxID=65048 RepID=UPI001AFD1A5B|nr:ferritin-like domain-containing protein [Roseateles chitosanitabidus]MBO9685320.1 ferritin-like domain-containing protein [Roseateles chitosanitabidus]
MTELQTAAHWSIEDLALNDIDVDRIRHNDSLFLLVCSASFVESGSDTYTRNLIERFEDDEEVAGWLDRQWEPEELQHGRALRAYVQRVWPGFDWEAAYADFFVEYARLCTMDELEPTRGQEMAARCIVEMGTTTYYQALHEACDEPVLRDLFWRIRGDEVQHYKHFYAYFQKYREREKLHRGQVLAALVRRALELRREDATIALRHAVAWRLRSGAIDGGPAPIADAEALAQRAIDLVGAHLPMELAIRMAIKPLALRPRVQRAVIRPLAALGRRVLLR